MRTVARAFLAVTLASTLSFAEGLAPQQRQLSLDAAFSFVLDPKRGSGMDTANQPIDISTKSTRMLKANTFPASLPALRHSANSELSKKAHRRGVRQILSHLVPNLGAAGFQSGKDDRWQATRRPCVSERTNG